MALAGNQNRLQTTESPAMLWFLTRRERMKYQLVVTMEDGREIKGDSKAELNRKVRLMDVADKLASIALAEDETIEDDKTLAKVCLALAERRKDVTKAYIIERKKRRAD